MNKTLLLAVMVASATAAMAAKTSGWPVGDTFPVTFPYPSEEVVFPKSSYPVFPKDTMFPEPEPYWPVAPFPAS